MWSYLLLGFVGVWIWVICAGIANYRTSQKRLELIKRWNSTGDDTLANAEFERVSYEQHYKACLKLRNPKKLYGPLLQSVWYTDTPDQIFNTKSASSRHWWRCYREIYLWLIEHDKPYLEASIRNYLAQGCTLSGAITATNINIEKWLPKAEGEGEEPPKFSMTQGAEEYDAIMEMQDMIQ